MKYLLLFVLTFNVFSSAPRSEELKFDKTIPLLLKNLTIELYINNAINQEDISKLNTLLNPNFDSDFINTTILKNLVTSYKDKQYEKQIISQKLYTEVEAKISQLDSKLVFSKQLGELILVDLAGLITSAEFPTYAKYSNKPQKLKSLELTRTFLRKASYIQYWLQIFTLSNEEFVTISSKEYLRVYRSITRDLKIISRTSKDTTLVPYISAVDIDLIKAKKAVDNLFFNNASPQNNETLDESEVPKAVHGW